MKKVIKVKTEKEMQNLGRALGQNLSGGDVIALTGPMGAGKTTLAKAILAGAGAGQGFSPTFLLDATFRVNKLNLKNIHHLDLYRLNNTEELLTLGLYDAIGKPDMAFLIEWADKFPELFKAFPNLDKMTIIIRPVLGNVRSLTIESKGKKHEKILLHTLNNFNKLSSA